MQLSNKLEPKVSTIVIVYNGETYLKEALNSIVSQDYDNHEIIIVNDGSTDGTTDILHEYSSVIKILNKENGGISTARNFGIEHSSGDYLNFCDCDDICPADRIKLLAKELTRENKLDFVFGEIEEFSENPNIISQRSGEVKAGVCCGGVMIKKSALDKVGRFDPDLKVAEFMDLLLRAKDLKLNFKVIKETVLRRRIHSKNNSYLNRDKLEKEYTRVLKNSLNRRKEI